MSEKSDQYDDLTPEEVKVIRETFKEYKPEPGISVEEARQRMLERGKAWLKEQEKKSRGA